MPLLGVIPALTILLLCSPRYGNDLKAISTHLKGVPITTVEELAASIRKDGFQWKFIGRQIDFKGTVMSAGPVPRVRIAGMDKDKLDTAWLHMESPDNSVKVGQQLRIRGLIIDQNYGVWRVWKYTWSVIDPANETSVPGSTDPVKPTKN